MTTNKIATDIARVCEYVINEVYYINPPAMEVKRQRFKEIKKRKRIPKKLANHIYNNILKL